MIGETSETSRSPRSPKKRIITFEEQYGDILQRLPSDDFQEKGPKITYNDGISAEQLERMRKESTNRLNARRQKEKEYQAMIKARNNRYRIDINFDDEKTPDFERQLTHAFNIKYRRQDALGVRNLVIDENNLMRASRPNMDKLVNLTHLKHEIRNPLPPKKEPQHDQEQTEQEEQDSEEYLIYCYR